MEVGARHDAGMSMDELRKRVRRIPEGALFSGRTAGWLHGLDLAPCEPIEITLPRRSVNSHLAGVRVRRSDFTASDACSVRGLPATSRTRTIADLARHAVVLEGIVVLDIALRRQFVTIPELATWIDDHPRHRGVGRLARAMALADARSDSPMESRLRGMLVLAGLPKPLTQETLRSADGSFLARPDLLYPRQRLVLEYDGVTHRDSLASDDQRQNRIVDAGYRVLRFTAGDVLHRPESVIDQVRRALRYSSGSPN